MTTEAESAVRRAFEFGSTIEFNDELAQKLYVAMRHLEADGCKVGNFVIPCSRSVIDLAIKNAKQQYNSICPDLTSAAVIQLGDSVWQVKLLWPFQVTMILVEV